MPESSRNAAQEAFIAERVNLGFGLETTKALIRKVLDANAEWEARRSTEAPRLPDASPAADDG